MPSWLFGTPRTCPQPSSHSYRSTYTSAAVFEIIGTSNRVNRVMLEHVEGLSLLPCRQTCPSRRHVTTPLVLTPMMMMIFSTTPVFYPKDATSSSIHCYLQNPPPNTAFRTCHPRDFTPLKTTTPREYPCHTSTSPRNQDVHSIARLLYSASDHFGWLQREGRVDHR